MGCRETKVQIPSLRGTPWGLDPPPPQTRLSTGAKVWLLHPQEGGHNSSGPRLWEGKSLEPTMGDFIMRWVQTLLLRGKSPGLELRGCSNPVFPLSSYIACNVFSYLRGFSDYSRVKEVCYPDLQWEWCLWKGIALTQQSLVSFPPFLWACLKSCSWEAARLCLGPQQPWLLPHHSCVSWARASSFWGSQKLICSWRSTPDTAVSTKLSQITPRHWPLDSAAAVSQFTGFLPTTNYLSWSRSSSSSQGLRLLNHGHW